MKNLMVFLILGIVAFASEARASYTPNTLSATTNMSGTSTDGYVPRASGAVAMVDSVIYVNSGGNVGIGSAIPHGNLDVNGTIYGTTFYGSGAGLTGLPSGSSQWTTAGSDIYYNSGNVGINSATPSAKLDVVGAISTSGAGDSYFASNVGIGTTTPAAELDVVGTARFGTVANRSRFESDGTLYFEGDAVVWDDMQMSGLSVKTQGTNDPTLDVFQGSVRAYAFADSATNEVFVSFQMSHAYREGTDITPHLHFAPNNTNTGDIRWCLEYSWGDIDAVMPSPTTVCVNITASGAQYQQQIGSFGAVSGTGKKISSVLVGRIYREGSNAADTYNDKAFLLSVDLHYQKDAVGSRDILTK